jgi:hypothetical protein
LEAGGFGSKFGDFDRVRFALDSSGGPGDWGCDLTVGAGLVVVDGSMFELVGGRWCCLNWVRLLTVKR